MTRPLPIGIFCERHPITEAEEVCRACGGGACRRCWTLAGGRVTCLHCAARRARRARGLKRALAVACALGALLMTIAAVDWIRFGSRGPAIREARQQLARTPRDIHTRLELARLLLAAGRRDEAMAEYQRALAFDPYSPRAHGNLGILLYERGELEPAAFHLGVSVELDPTYYDAHRTRARIQERRLDTRGAIDSWRRALELAPGRDERLEAGHALAANLERAGRAFEAAEVLYDLAPWVSGRSASDAIAARIARLRRQADSGEPLLTADAVEVRFQPRGSVIPVRGLLDGHVPVFFIVDTGATYTTIPSDLAERAGFDDLEERSRVGFRTATGEITSAPLVQVDSLQIGDAYVEDLTLAVCDACADGLIDGLLGLNFLQRFEVEIDSGSGRLILRRRGE